MKIIFISGNLCDGGAQRVIAVVASRLAEEGHDVGILLFARNEKEYSISDKVKITALKENFEEYQKMSFFAKTSFIRRYLKQEKPQVAIGFLEGGYGLYLSSFGLKIKKVASARIDPLILWQQKGFRAKINRRWFKAADAIVLQTEKQKEHIPKKLRAKSTIIANPVSELALQTNVTKYNENCRRFVMVGRLSEQKNYQMAFEAISIVREKYPDVRLDVFGKGGYESHLLEMIKEKQLFDCVKLCGWTTNTAETYMNYDAYLMTSNYEGMPNALMEAMAVGLPCISTDCDTGPADLIEDTANGYLVPVEDVETLAARMIKLIEMPLEKRKNMAIAAKKTIDEKFNSKKIANEWLELFKELTEK